MATKRKLPVIASPPASGASGIDPPRSARQWVGFGIVSTFAAWLPLALLATAVGTALAARVAGPLDPSEAAADAAARVGGLEGSRRVLVAASLLGPQVFALAAAAAATGFLVGRFGAPAGPREAALSVGLAVAGAAALAGASLAAVGGAVALVAVGAPIAALVAGRARKGPASPA